LFDTNADAIQPLQSVPHFEYYHLGLKESSTVVSEVVAEDVRMLRFLTPTVDWKSRIGSRMSLPREWLLILVEILHGEDRRLLMTCASVFPRERRQRSFPREHTSTSLTSFRRPSSTFMDAHFAAVENNIAKKLDSLLPAIKPKLVLVKK